MSNQSKKEYLVTVRERYRNCQARDEKSAIISEVETNLGIVRKSAIRLLKQNVFVRRKTIRSRKEIYGFDLVKPLKLIWEVIGQPCSKRSPLLKTLIPVRTNFNAKELKEPGHTEMDCVLHCGDSVSTAAVRTGWQR